MPESPAPRFWHAAKSNDFASLADKRRNRQLDLRKPALAARGLGRRIILHRGKSNELELAAAQRLTLGRPGTAIRSVGLKQARLHVVGQRTAEHFMNESLAQDAILDGECQFNAPEKIARHPIGAADEDLRLAGILKIIYPA